MSVIRMSTKERQRRRLSVASVDVAAFVAVIIVVAVSFEVVAAREEGLSFGELKSRYGFPKPFNQPINHFVLYACTKIRLIKLAVVLEQPTPPPYNRTTCI